MNRRGPDRGHDHITLTVSNWTQSKAASGVDGGTNSLVQFLEKKASPPRGPALEIYRSEVHGDLMYITVEAESVNRFLHLNGFTWAGAQLKVEETQTRDHQPRPTTNSLESRISRPGQQRDMMPIHSPTGPRNTRGNRGGNQQQTPQQRYPTSHQTMPVGDQPMHNHPLQSSQRQLHSAKMSMDEKAPASLLPDSPPQFNDSSGIAEPFIKKFFVLYDTDRTEAIKLFYDDTSTFSLSVSTVPPPRSQAKLNNTNPTIPPETRPNFTAYLPQSRNLLKISNPRPRAARKFTGQAAIHTAWTQLPATSHLALSDPSSYTVEVIPVPNIPEQTGCNAVTGLQITVTSLFQDEISPGTQEIKYFFRTFILGPGTGPGGIRVLSDLLVLRAPRPKELMILRFKGDSKLKWQFAAEALVQNNWDYDTAGRLFLDLNQAGQIPADAFAL